MATPSLFQRILRKAFKPLYPLYYRLLWDRSFPGAGRVRRVVDRWEALSERGDTPRSGGDWDREYSAGQWDFMGAPDEAARYGALMGLVRGWSSARSILDVGCGEGLLRQACPASEEIRYVGVDLSEVAIERARGRVEAGDLLVMADAESWTPGETFDAVVLNECLYYFEEPLHGARRYWGARSPDGALLVSMFSGPRSRAIRRALSRHLPLRQELEIKMKKGVWWMAAFREED